MFSRHKRAAPALEIPHDLHELRRANIAEDAATLPEAVRAAAIARTATLYDVGYATVAPVITGFADSLLHEAKGRQIICAARDGLGTFRAAKQLGMKFDYPKNTPEQVSYAYLTRSVVFSSGALAVRTHLEQIGVDPEADGLLADIGMFGSFVSTMKSVMPGIQTRYLISANPSIPGYAHDTKKHRMNSMQHIVGNPAVHFIEDTFSGPIPTPRSLNAAADGALVPDTASQTYAPDIALCRKYALQAIEDYVADLSNPPKQPATAAVNRLDAFLSNTDNYSDIMVPHER